MIVERGRGREVIVRYRDKNDERTTLKLNESWPYCFVETEHAGLFNAVRKEDGYTGTYGEPLTKIVASDPSMILEVREQADAHGLRTWEANIPFVNRVLIDRLMEE